MSGRKFPVWPLTPGRPYDEFVTWRKQIGIFQRLATEIPGHIWPPALRLYEYVLFATKERCVLLAEASTLNCIQSAVVFFPFPPCEFPPAGKVTVC